jgi:hypothetical protein
MHPSDSTNAWTSTSQDGLAETGMDTSLQCALSRTRRRSRPGDVGGLYDGDVGLYEGDVGLYEGNVGWYIGGLQLGIVGL